MVSEHKFSSVAIVTHVYATGPAFFLEDYLVTQSIKKLLFIGLPFSYATDTYPFIRYYENGKLIEEKQLKSISVPHFLFYLRDVCVVLYYVYRKKPFELYVGVDNLNAVTGLILQFSKCIKYVVFYTIDYVPIRFSNVLLNHFYHFIEKVAVYKSNVVWNLSQKMREEREKNGYSPSLRKKQIRVPIGTMPIKNLTSYSYANRLSIVFMGHLREKQGVDFLLRAFTKIIAIKKNAKLVIIGGGTLENYLKKLARSLNITKNVKFTGFVKDYTEVQNLLASATIAAAPYVDDAETYTRFTDPGKVKDYLSMGIPVIVTKVPEVAYEIEKRKAGYAIDYNEDQFVQAVKHISKDEQTINKYRKNAYSMALEYTWTKVFTKALKETKKLC